MNQTLLEPVVKPRRTIDPDQILAHDPIVRQQLGKLQNVEDNLGRSNFIHFRMQVLRTALTILASDILACSICFGWAGLLTGVSLFATSPMIVAGLIAGLVATFMAIGLYSTGGLSPVCEFRLIAIGCGTLAVSILTIASSHPNYSTMLLALGMIFLLLPVARSISRRLLSQLSWWGLKSIVFDCDRRVDGLYSGHLEATSTGFRPVGFIQNSIPANLGETISDHYLGTYDHANRAMHEKGAYVALVHRRGRADHEIIKFVNQKLRFFSKIIVVPDDNRLPALWSLDSSGGIVLEDQLLCTSAQVMKRLLDLGIAFMLVALASPLLLLTSAYLAATMRSSVFVREDREGQYGRKFKLLKFRTHPNGQSSPTRFGRFLKSTGLDEFPQLFNVLRGHMSLVGPRPIAPQDTQLFLHKLDSYHRVKPGVTGFWQVSGKIESKHDHRVELDEFYVRNWTLWFDFYILWRSLKSVALERK